MTKDFRLTDLNASQLPATEALLKSCDLPFEDCEEHLNNFIGMLSGDKLIAIGALQLDGPIALLRSIAVDPEYRGAGLAANMTQHLLHSAREAGITEIYLLTETAGKYFTRFGFHAVGRDTLPLDIQKTRQFETLCPASAQAMRLEL